jgi:hypothetical protein
MYSILVPTFVAGFSLMEFQLTVMDDAGDTSSDWANVAIVPEPASGLLLMSGMAFAAALRWRQRLR